MKIAVTGGMGFIGHELVGELLSLGHEVVLVDFWRDLIPRYEGTKMPIVEEIYKIIPRCSAVVDPWEFLVDFNKHSPQVVVHGGAIVDTKDLGGANSRLFDLNVQYTENLTKVCDESGAGIIFISSAAVYGNHGHPNNPYGLTKAMGEKIVRRSRARTASLRLFNVFGRYEHHKGEMASVPWKIARAYEKGHVFHLHSPEAARDFVPSKGVVQAVIGVAYDMMGPGEKWHREFDVGTGRPTTFATLADLVMKTMGKSQSMIQSATLPADLVGRYQFFTQAGTHGVKNIGDMFGTSQGISEAYGVDNR